MDALTMQDYRVELDVYHGPLDLLLYLIRRDEIDIEDIPIARITEQYLRFVQTLRALDINLAGEFLVMAATLMEIKSAMMSPRGEGEGEALEELTGAGEEEGDPRYELVQQLLAYKRFKDAAHALDRRRQTFAAQYPRRPAPLRKEEAEEASRPVELDMEDVSVWDLMEAFSALMEQVAGPPRVDFTDDDTPIELHEADIVDRLEREGPATLQSMFQGRRFGEMVGLFLALLELLRQRKVRAAQEDDLSEIRLELRPRSEWEDPDAQAAAGAEDAGWNYDPSDAENFDWPDERTRRRYARRIERRKRGEVIIEDKELDEEIRAIEQEESGEGGEDGVVEESS